VRNPALLLLLLLAGPARGETLTAAQALNQPLIAQVVAVSLGFIAPRALEPVPLATLTMWGLRGLTTLDQNLTPDLVTVGKGTQLVLRQASPGQANPARVVLTLPAPAPNSAAGWGEAAAQMARAAWDVSEPLRRAGTAGFVRTFFDELFNHLDPYSRYVPPDEAEADRSRRDGSAGVGIHPAMLRGVPIVGSVDAGSPAALAEIRPGERIAAIDGLSTQGADQQAITALLAGPDGSLVTLTLRARDGKITVISLVRIATPPETVIASRRDDMLVLRVTGFASTTAARIGQELIRGVDATPPPAGVVIDLRGNRGGLLRQAVNAAAMLQPAGVVAITAGRDPEAAHDFIADGRDLAPGLPVVVVVDGRSASAAEIFAAALADQGRAVVVGSSTLGKGLVQTVTGLPDGGELLVTWSRVLAPDGWPLQALGVLPQVCTSLGEDALRRQMAALGAGVQPMQAALARHRAARAPLSPASAIDIRAACPAAEGRDLDLLAAQVLIDSPSAYVTALLRAPPPSAATRLTAPVPLRN
jgi:carboxyl-terminal processing protease